MDWPHRGALLEYNAGLYRWPGGEISDFHSPQPRGPASPGGAPRVCRAGHRWALYGLQRELLQKLIEGEASPIWQDQQVYRIFCSYSGWGAGQLDAELAAGGWVVQPATAEYIFRTDSPQMWKSSMEREGGIYRFFSGMPVDPDVN